MLPAPKTDKFAQFRVLWRTVCILYGCSFNTKSLGSITRLPVDRQKRLWPVLYIYSRICLVFGPRIDSETSRILNSVANYYTENFGGLYFTQIVVSRQCNCYIIIHEFQQGSNTSSIWTLEYRGWNELFISEFKTFSFTRTHEYLDSLMRKKIIIPEIYSNIKYSPPQIFQVVHI